MTVRDDLCPDCGEEQEQRDLGRALLRLLPDATPERVAAVVGLGLAVERLQQSKRGWRIELLGAEVIGVQRLLPEGPWHHGDETLASAVAAALGETDTL